MSILSQTHFIQVNSMHGVATMHAHAAACDRADLHEVEERVLFQEEVNQHQAPTGNVVQLVLAQK